MEAADEIISASDVLEKAWAVGITDGYGQDSPLEFSKFCRLPLGELAIKDTPYYRSLFGNE